MTNQEPRYSRAVFEKLLDASEDDDIRSNYDIRDDGVWLREDDEAGSLNWTPVCDLEEGPESPDPLETPALPFPFIARELAAFMLDGWGWFLGQALGGGGDLSDEDAVNLRLGGGMNTKPREAIKAAFLAIQNAQLKVPAPTPELEQALSRAQKECEDAEKTVGAEHDWRDMSQPEAVREERRLAYLAAVNPDRQKKSEAQNDYDDAQDAWRKAMVRELLPIEEESPAQIEGKKEGEVVPPVFTGNAAAMQVRRRMRRDLLSPLVERAMKECDGDAQKVFVLMRKWAKEKPPTVPLFGVTEDGKIQWEDANGNPKEINISGLRDRVRRMLDMNNAR